MTQALQVPTWENPLTGATLTDLYLVMERFSIDVTIQTYTITIGVYTSQAAYNAGRRQVAKIHYTAADGVFPTWAAAFADNNFQAPLVALRNWMYDTMKTNDPRLAGAIDL
jgi:hypothetical protein